MVIGIDLRCLPVDGSPGAGVAHAARFLVEALLKKEVPWEWRLYVPIGADRNPFAFPLQKGEKKGVLILPDSSGASLRHALRERPCDLLFVPGGSIAPFLSVPAIPWVHDLAIFDHPEWFPQSWFRRFITTTMFRRGVKRAPIIFAVSEETKKQLIVHVHLAPERIIVTHEGGDPLLSSVIPAEAGNQPRPADMHGLDPCLRRGDERFVLFLGTIEPRKNLSMLIRAWNMAQPSLPQDAELVIAGRNGWKCKEILREINATSRVRRIVDVDDAKKRELLSTATIVAVPSLYEGFGLVALEAMQAGTPLIASRTGSLPEVVGDGGMLLDPQDVSAWADAIKQLMGNEEARQKLAEAGREQAKKFSWEKTATVLVDGIKKSLFLVK